MKRIFLLCLTALCLSASLNLLPTYSQQTTQNADWKVLLDSARSFERQAKSDSALSYALRAVEAMKKRTSQHPDTNYVQALNIVSFSYIETQKYDLAELYVNEAFTLIQKFYSIDNHDVAKAIINKGYFLNSKGKYADAEPFFNQSLEMNRRLSKSFSDDLANAVERTANNYFSLGNYLKAETLLLEAVDIRKKLHKGDHPFAANALGNLAYFYAERGRNAEAAPLYEESLGMLRRLFKNDNEILAQTISNVGAFYYRSARFDDAEMLFIEALAMRRRLHTGDNIRLAEAMNNLGVHYTEIRSKYVDAELLYEESLAMRRRIYNREDHPNLTTSIINLASFYRKIGKYAQAEPLYKEGLEMSKRLYKTDNPSMISALRNVAIFYEDLGRYEEAESTYLEVLAMNRRLYKVDHSSLYVAISQMARFYYARSRSAEAEPLLLELLAMSRRLYKGDNSEVATTLTRIAQHNYRLGKYAQAESLFVDANTMYKKVVKNDHNYLVANFSNLAQLYNDRGKITEAEPLFLESLSMCRRLYKQSHPTLARIITNVANFYENHARYSEASLLYKESLEIHIRSLNSYFYSLSEREKQVAWATMSRYFEQYNSFSCAQGTKNSDEIGQMYDNQLATKGLLLSSTQKVKSRIVASGDTALVALLSAWQTQKDQIAKFAQLPKAELDKKRINLDSLENLANAAEKELSRRSEAFATAFDNTRASWRDVQKTLKADEAAIEIVRFRHFGSVPNKFDTTVRVMDYVPDSIRYAALILTPKTNNQPELVMLPDGNKLEKEWLQRYKTTIQGGKGMSANTATDNDSYNAYWKPIAEKLKKLSPKLKTVYVSPDGAYNQVNLSTLYNPATKKYVLDELDVRTVTNTKDLLQPPGSEQSKKSIASMKTGEAELFGYPDFNLDTASYAKAKMQMLALAQPNADTRGASDVSQKAVAETQKTQITQQIIPEDRALANLNFRTLPGTKTEVEEVSSLLAKNTWSVKAHTGAEALEEAVKAVNNPRVLHIATHGFFLPNADRDVDGKYKAGQNPLLRSGLALAGANRKIDASTSTAEDGILTAYEAMNLNLDKTELVVLSACETGLGEVKNGEGVYGLQRAFKVAGAKSLIMSLWAVSDNATQKLMVEFYRQWTAGKSKRAALRAAQNTLRADTRYKAPYYWGAFVLVGE